MKLHGKTDDDFLSAHEATSPAYSDKNERIMKIYGKTDNV